MFFRDQIEILHKWKNNPSRKPLIVRGARQVGKTTLVDTFGQQFKQYIYINLERKNDAELFEKIDDVHQLITVLFLEKRKKKDLIKDTLLFIDEIQEQPKVVNLLRYFKEEIPDLAVIAAGSMLETLLGKNLTFPVGRVEYLVLRPVSFKEYLKATGEELLLDEYLKTPIEKYAEKSLLKAFHTYALLGGMPEIIDHYSKHKDITALGPIYDALINSYLEDAEKYAKSEQQLQLIRFAIHQVMLKAGQRTTLQGFGNANYTSKSIGEVLRALEKTHLIKVLYPVTGTILPLVPDQKKTPRIQFLDSGLINYFVGLQQEIISTDDLDKVYNGTLIEHLVGQELLSFQSLSLDRLHFWVRQKKQSDAEIDFLYPYKGKVIPIEVKSGPTGKLKSLLVFMDRSPLHFGIRFYAGNLQVDELQTREGKRFYLLSLPYFLSARIEEYIDWLVDQIGWESPQKMIVNEQAPKYKKSKKDKKWTIELLTPKHFVLLRLCLEEPKKGKTLIEKGLKLSYQSRNKKEYIKPLVDLGLLEYTDKEYLKSKQQKYQLTKKGHLLIT